MTSGLADLISRVDSSETHDLRVPMEAGEAGTDANFPFLIWDPDGEHLYAVPSDFAGGDEMGGPSRLVRYRLDRTNWTLVESRQLGEIGFLIDWAVPGYSFWIRDHKADIKELILP